VVYGLAFGELTFKRRFVEGLRETLDTELLGRVLNAFDEQRDWRLGDWRVGLACPVRTLVPYHGDLIAFTGIYGGVYSVEGNEWMLRYDRWFDPFDVRWVPGDGLDVVLAPGFDSPYILKYDGASFKWVTTPTVPVALTRPYSVAENTTAEDMYFLGGDRYVYLYNPRTDAVTRRGAVLGVPRWAGFGSAGRGGKAYFSNSHPTAPGIYAYDPVADSLSRVYPAEYIHFLAEYPGVGFIAVAQPLGRRQVRLVWTRDFTTFREFILPESVAFMGGVNEFGIPPVVFKGQEGLAMIYSRGVVYSIGFFPAFPVPWPQPRISPLFSSPVQIDDMALWRGHAVVAYKGGWQGDKGDRFYTYIEFARPSELFKVGLLPAYAVVWYNTSIGAGDTSPPVITSGWREYTLVFKSNTAGDLTVQVDVDGTGEWEDYITRTATTKEVLTIDEHFYALRLRFSVAATVTAKLFLVP
jgi:hypothetical protein